MNYLDAKKVIELFPGIGTIGHLANLRVQKRGPRYYKIGRKVVYKIEDIERFLSQNPCETKDSINLR